MKLPLGDWIHGRLFHSGPLLYEGGAEVIDVRGERAQLYAGSIVFRGEGLKEGQILHVEIYGPPWDPRSKEAPSV